MRRRLMLKSSAGVSPALPAEYQRVEWVENPDSAYFSLGVVNPDGIDLTFSTASQYSTVFIGSGFIGYYTSINSFEIQLFRGDAINLYYGGSAQFFAHTFQNPSVTKNLKIRNNILT